MDMNYNEFKKYLKEETKKGIKFIKYDDKNDVVYLFIYCYDGLTNMFAVKTIDVYNKFYEHIVNDDFYTSDDFVSSGLDECYLSVQAIDNTIESWL